MREAGRFLFVALSQALGVADQPISHGINQMLEAESAIVALIITEVSEQNILFRDGRGGWRPFCRRLFPSEFCLRVKKAKFMTAAGVFSGWPGESS